MAGAVTGRTWSLDDIKYLRENYPTKTNTVLMKEMDRSDSALRTKADRLGIGKNYNWKINKVNLTPSPSLSYLIGVIFGDGCVTIMERPTGRTNYNIDLDVIDRDFVDAFNDALFGVLGKRYAVCQFANRYQVRGQSKILYTLLKGKDVNRVKHLIEPFPCDFIRGFADSEGSVCISKCNGYPWLKISIGCTNQVVIEYINSLLKAQNVRSAITTKQPSGRFSIKKDGSIIVSKKMMYILNIYDKSSMKLYTDKIGFSIARKQNTLLEYWQKYPTWRKNPLSERQLFLV
jgi:intein-encoded DNA endonuclease-like protein